MAGLTRGLNQKMRKKVSVTTISTLLVSGTRSCYYNTVAHSIGLHHVGTNHKSLSVDQAASAENTEATLSGSNMLSPRRPVPSSALSEGGESCRPGTSSTGEANKIVHHRESETVRVEQPVDYSTLEVPGLEYNEVLNSYCKDAVMQPKPDHQSNILEDLEPSSTSGSSIPGKKEWIPFTLGKWPTFSLALALFFLVGLLEYLDRLSRER